jgi:hypothetical protein
VQPFEASVPDEHGHRWRLHARQGREVVPAAALERLFPRASAGRAGGPVALVPVGALARRRGSRGVAVAERAA